MNQKYILTAVLLICLLLISHYEATASSKRKFLKKLLKKSLKKKINVLIPIPIPFPLPMKGG